MLLSFLLIVSVIGTIFVLALFCLFQGLIVIEQKALRDAALFFCTGSFAVFSKKMRSIACAKRCYAEKNIAKTTLQKCSRFFILGLFLFLFLYCNTYTVYCLDEETAKKLGEVSVNNNVNIHNPNINLPDSVFKVLTNIGLAGTVGVGIRATTKIVKNTSLPPIAKLGLMAAGGLVGGLTVTSVNTINSLIEKKINSTSYSNNGLNNTNTNDGNNGPGSAFSIEPSADIDTVMSLLEANYWLHICILYIIWAILSLCIANMILKNGWKLRYIKNIFGVRIHSYILKAYTYTSKSNNFFIVLGLIFLIIASISGLYIGYFLLHNIDIVSEIVLESKSK